MPPDATRNAYNSIECYRQVAPGVIKTRFTYRAGGFDGERKTIRPTAFVVEGSDNAVWGMQFIWPIKLQYVISYVSSDYETTIVAREDRDLAWIMARTPIIDAATYQWLVERVSALGYDTERLRRVPQQPLSQRNDL